MNSSVLLSSALNISATPGIIFKESPQIHACQRPGYVFVQEVYKYDRSDNPKENISHRKISLEKRIKP